jgi:hypothetical protein
MTRDEVITLVNDAVNYAKQVDAILWQFMQGSGADEERSQIIAAIMTINDQTIKSLKPLTDLTSRDIKP